MSAKREAAKASREIAKVAGKAIDAARASGGFLEKVLGRGVIQLGETFGDWAHVYRYRNALKLADKVEDLHRRRGVAGKTVPIAPRLAIPIIQGATLEDDTTLQNMWAALLANAMDPSRTTDPKRLFVRLLTNLEPLDAKVLKVIHKHQLANPNRPGALGEKAFRRNASWIAKKMRKPVKDIMPALEGLASLGLVEDYFPRNVRADGPIMVTVPVTHPRAHLVVTFTGAALLKACAEE